MEYKDYYATLGLTRQATPEEIKRAYRRLARKYHPDVSKEANAESRFKEIQEAYEVLKDPTKRTAYDNMGSNWKAGQEWTPPHGWNGNFEFRSDFTDPGSFSDFFETLFGRGHGDFRRVRTKRDQPNPQGQDNDHHAKIKIDIDDAYNGTTRSVVLAMPTMDAQGHITTSNRTIRVKIPQGIMAGQHIRLAGQGNRNSRGEPGDLYLEVLFHPHKLFTVEQRDVQLELPITPWEAALGRTITVPTLGGKVELRLPAGSQTGNKLRLRGRGLPGNPPGDQIVNLRLVIPEAKTLQAKEFYERMERELPLYPRNYDGVGGDVPH